MSKFNIIAGDTILLSPEISININGMNPLQEPMFKVGDLRSAIGTTYPEQVVYVAIRGVNHRFERINSMNGVFNFGDSSITAKISMGWFVGELARLNQDNTVTFYPFGSNIKYGVVQTEGGDREITLILAPVRNFTFA